MPLVAVLWLVYAAVVGLVVVAALVAVGIALWRIGPLLSQSGVALGSAGAEADALAGHLAALHEAVGGAPEDLARIRARQFPVQQPLAAFEPWRAAAQPQRGRV